MRLATIKYITRFFVCLILSVMPFITTIARADMPKEITVGWIGVLSGSSSVLGVNNLNAIKLAIMQYNQSKKPDMPTIRLVTADDKKNGEITQKAFKEMLAKDHPQIIFILTNPGLINIAEDALKNNILIINPLNNEQSLSRLNHNIFLIAKQTEGIANTLAEAMLAQGKKFIAIFYNTDDNFDVVMADTIKQIYENAKANLLMLPYSQQVYQKINNQFQTLLKEAIKKNVDAYVFLGYAELGHAMKQAREMGIKKSFYSINIVTSPDIQKNSEGAINGIQYPDTTQLDGNPLLTKKFLAEYQAAYGKHPEPVWPAMQGYDAANILIDAIQMSYPMSGDFINNLRQTLLNTTNYEGVSGNISIKADGSSRGIYTSIYTLTEGAPVKNKN